MDSWRVVHDSQDKKYRSPFGAVSCLQAVLLRLKTEETAPWQSVVLRLWQNGRGESLLPLTRKEQGWFEVEFKPEQTGLIWYYFIILEGDGRRWYYGNNAEVLGGIGQFTDVEPPSYQLTVYEEQQVPQWYKEGVMYQIFVDRFCKGAGPEREAPPGALLHAHWEDTPVYTKDIQTTEILAYDFFGGNLAGIREKLSYLKSLGITILYLNPIFESVSNHKYDTGDYHKIDPMFGTKEEFTALCSQAAALGIHILLDGVFSHTGSDSLYFNRYGRYDSIGAYQSPESPYYSWFRFSQYPEKYESWWGIDTLPNVEELDPSYRQFIIHDEDSVVRSWIKAGAKGWRLDVVDELPPLFLKELRQAVKETDPEAVILGEVWEDASRKESYGEQREYLLGKELDSTMNYPFRRIVLDFALGYISAGETHRRIMSLYENYPREHFYSAMNLIDSHDVPRALSLLGDQNYTGQEPIAKLGRRKLSEQERRVAKSRLKLLVLWQMTFPGVPCVYYGDEAGMEGYQDPLNRRTYPWGKEDHELMNWYKKLISLREQYDLFRSGEFLSLVLAENVYAYRRQNERYQAVIVLNRSSDWETVTLCADWAEGAVIQDILFEEPILKNEKGDLLIALRPYEGKVLFADKQKQRVGEPQRCAGVLLHPTSLPTRDRLGGLGAEAYEFVDFLAGAGQSIWQVLPLNPVGFGESPYQCPSAFAGNPLLLDLAELAGIPWSYAGQPQEYAEARQWKEEQLRLIYQAVKDDFSQQEKSFCNQQGTWLKEYALFTALTKCYGSPWSTWPEPLRRREPLAIAQALEELAEEVSYQNFLQYNFFRQWGKLRMYAKKKSIRILGDMPLYVAYDSADVWSRPELFELDEDLMPLSVAGVPPDYFSDTGQLWGNPLYKWPVHDKEDYRWWRQRLTLLLCFVDQVRLDHFRGIEAYYAIPAGATTAKIGEWLAGPGEKLLAALKQDHSPLPLLAEDLGYITPEVIKLKEDFNLPGMQVLHFSFYQTEAGCARLAVPYHSFIYTGTHDNNTTVGWFDDSLQGTGGESCLTWLNGPMNVETVAAKLIELAYASQAYAAIIPVQDLLALGSEFRMNTPGTVGGNWKFKLEAGGLTNHLQQWLKNLAIKYQRN